MSREAFLVWFELNGYGRHGPEPELWRTGLQSAWQAATEQSAKEIEQLKSDCNFLHEKNQRLDNLLHTQDKELQELRALVAMKDDAFLTIQSYVDPLSIEYGIAEKALTASPSVAAWEKEKLEPIMRERNLLAEAIANTAIKMGIFNGEVPLSGPQLLMLCEDMGNSLQPLQKQVAHQNKLALSVCQAFDEYCKSREVGKLLFALGGLKADADNVLSNTQATTEAFMNEERAKVLEEFQYSTTSQIQFRINQLRATKKGGV